MDDTSLEGPWSPPVTDSRGFALRGRLVVRVRPRPDRHREAAVFVELEDASTTVHGGMRVRFDPDALRCQMRRGGGPPLPPEPFAFGGAAPRPTWIDLPCDTRVRLRSSPFGLWRPDALAIAPSLGTLWTIPDRSRIPHWLSGTLTVAPDGPTVSDPQIWRGTLVLPALRLPPV